MMKGKPTVPQRREIYDVYDLKLALVALNGQGFELEVSAKDAKRLHVTCKRAQNRFVVQEVGQDEWPNLAT